MKKAVIKRFKNKRMYVNIGNNRNVPVSGIVGVFDMDSCTRSPDMQKWLVDIQSRGQIINVAESLPKSIIYYDDGVRESVYFSPFAWSVILGRIK